MKSFVFSPNTPGKLVTILLMVFVLFFATLCEAQEVIQPLKYNTQLMYEKTKDFGTRDIGESRDTLCLPFFDDFSNTNICLLYTSPSPRD